MAKKKTSARRYKASLTLDNVDLAKAKSAIKLDIYDRGEKLGELQIGRGSLFWFGAKRQHGKRFWWGQVAAILNERTYDD